jgi:hypothetical protein
VALYPFLSKVTVPRGVADLAKDLPPADVTLFAPKASLVVRKDLHPAVQDLLLSAAMKIHSGVGIFHRAGRFPAAEGTDLPLSDQAVQFYKSGMPILQSHFPFWMASLIGRLLVLVVPILALLYPIMRFLPAFYGWLMRARIAQLYGELRFLEDEIGARGVSACAHDRLARRCATVREMKGIGSAPLSDRTVDHCRGCWRTHRVAREDAIKERKAARCAYASLRHEGSIGNLPRHHGGRWSERGAGQQGSAARCLPRLRNARDDRRRCADSLGATRQQRRV